MVCGMFPFKIMMIFYPANNQNHIKITFQLNSKVMLQNAGPLCYMYSIQHETLLSGMSGPPNSFLYFAYSGKQCDTGETTNCHCFHHKLVYFEGEQKQTNNKLVYFEGP